MSDAFYVDPEELRAAVTEVAAATGALEDARAALDAAGDLVRNGIDHAERADDKVATFVRQWRSEFEIIGDFLHAFDRVLSEAAACYEELDESFAATIEAC